MPKRQQEPISNAKKEKLAVAMTYVGIMKCDMLGNCVAFKMDGEKSMIVKEIANMKNEFDLENPPNSCDVCFEMKSPNDILLKESNVENVKLLNRSEKEVLEKIAEQKNGRRLVQKEVLKLLDPGQKIFTSEGNLEFLVDGVLGNCSKSERKEAEFSKNVQVGTLRFGDISFKFVLFSDKFYVSHNCGVILLLDVPVGMDGYGQNVAKITGKKKGWAFLEIASDAKFYQKMNLDYSAIQMKSIGMKELENHVDMQVAENEGKLNSRFNSALMKIKILTFHPQMQMIDTTRKLQLNILIEDVNGDQSFATVKNVALQEFIKEENLPICIENQSKKELYAAATKLKMILLQKELIAKVQVFIIEEKKYKEIIYMKY